METIYRVQNRYGKGPYSYKERLENDRALFTMFRKHENDKYHSGPIRDCGRAPVRGVEACAFESMDSLRLWFTEDDLKVLHRHRFRIYRIVADVTARGHAQVLFNVSTIVSTVKMA